MISVFQGWPRKIPGSYTLVTGFLICQYTVQYTSCILRETGGILAGLWVACVASVPVLEACEGVLRIWAAHNGARAKRLKVGWGGGD